MKSLKKKMVISFIALIVLSASLTGFSVFRNYMKYIDNSIREKLNLAVNAAALVYDFTDMAQLLEPGAESSDYYVEGLSLLNRLNESIGTEYIYAILENDGGYIFTFDSGDLTEPDDLAFLQPITDWDTLALAWQSGELMIDEEYYTDEWGTYRSACLPLKNERGEVYAAIGADIEASEIGSIRTRTITMLLTTLFAVIAATAAIAWLTANRITGPIVFTSRALEEIASGNGDLTRRLDSRSGDELGTMVNSYNRFVNTMSGMVGRISKAGTELDQTGETLASNMEETAASVRQISASIVTLKKQILDHDNSISASTGIVEELIDKTGTLGKDIIRQTEDLSESSSAIEEMIGNISALTESVKKSDEVYSQLAVTSREGKTRIEEAGRRVMAIAGQSESLQEANTVIAGIASMTNLLAMNAAIEAAHAGDAGRGFSVVADEIRKLAEKSSEQSKHIGTSLKNVMDSIYSVVDATKKADLVFEKLLGLVEILAPLSSQIASALEEQGEGSSRLLHTLAALNSITNEILQKSENMQNGSSELKENVALLKKASGIVAANITEIESGAEEIRKSAENTMSLTVYNKQCVGELKQEISAFKI